MNVPHQSKMLIIRANHSGSCVWGAEEGETVYGKSILFPFFFFKPKTSLKNKVN